MNIKALVMKTRSPVYGDRIDRKARLAERNHRNVIRESELDKYLAEDENSKAQSVPKGKTGRTGVNQIPPLNEKETL